MLSDFVDGFEVRVSIQSGDSEGWPRLWITRMVWSMLYKDRVFKKCVVILKVGFWSCYTKRKYILTFFKNPTSKNYQKVLKSTFQAVKRGWRKQICDWTMYMYSSHRTPSLNMSTHFLNILYLYSNKGSSKIGENWTASILNRLHYFQELLTIILLYWWLKEEFIYVSCYFPLCFDK